MKIIVNADDLGYSAKINDRIIDLVSRGQITSASLLANAPAVEDAVRRLSKGMKCSLGVHLNLTEFEPLTPPRERIGLTECLSPLGTFLGEESLRNTSMTTMFREACLREWSLQVEKLLALGANIGHFDSHNHIHTIPQLFPILKRLQKRFGIRKVRTTWNIYDARSEPALSVVVKKRAWQLALRHYFRTTTTDGFASLAVFLKRAKEDNLSFDSIEVEVHPGHATYEYETSLLESNWTETIPYTVHLISYDEL